MTTRWRNGLSEMSNTNEEERVAVFLHCDKPMTTAGCVPLANQGSPLSRPQDRTKSVADGQHVT